MGNSALWRAGWQRHQLRALIQAKTQRFFGLVGTSLESGHSGRLCTPPTGNRESCGAARGWALAFPLASVNSDRKRGALQHKIKIGGPSRTLFHGDIG